MLRIMIAPVGKDKDHLDKPSSDDPFNTADQPPSDQPKPRTKYDIEKASQQASGYLGPEMGPFECEHCIHWEDPHDCNIVSGYIDPHGCCNLFEPAGNNNSPEGPDQVEGTPAEEAGEAPEVEAAEGETVG